MAQTIPIDFVASEERVARLRVAAILNKIVFSSLLVLVVLSAIPYGTVEPWWKAAFVCAAFAICIVAIIESLISGESRIGGPKGILWSMLALAALAFLQTITIRQGSPDAGVAALQPWNAISADPYQTRFFVLQILALTVCLALLYRYCTTKKRINVVIHLVIGIAVGSALYGILRQTAQHQPGFVLPHTLPGQGYGQFINKNHFALLMEMALGLGLGVALTRGLTKERVMSYVALLLPIWTALVLSNSRGGILAMLVQVVMAAILLTSGKLGARELPNYKILRSKSVRVVLLLALVAVLFSGAVWVGGDKLVSSFGEASTELNPDANGLRGGATRNEIWQASWKMFTAHPMLGVGLGGYWSAITAYHDASGSMTPQEAHNDYLELLSSSGVVGFALGIWFFISLFRAVKVNLNSDDRFQRSACFAAVIAMTGVAVHSLVDFGLHLLVNAFIFLILVMVATKKIDATQ
ncbi:MAG TPA: O-antigen ligase family protein [Pyrinomonadaceae bacterium]